MGFIPAFIFLPPPGIWQHLSEPSVKHTQPADGDNWLSDRQLSLRLSEGPHLLGTVSSSSYPPELSPCKCISGSIPSRASLFCRQDTESSLVVFIHCLASLGMLSLVKQQNFLFPHWLSDTWPHKGQRGLCVQSAHGQSTGQEAWVCGMPSLCDWAVNAVNPPEVVGDDGWDWHPGSSLWEFVSTVHIF